MENGMRLRMWTKKRKRETQKKRRKFKQTTEKKNSWVCWTENGKQTLVMFRHLNWKQFDVRERKKTFKQIKGETEWLEGYMKDDGAT